MDGLVRLLGRDNVALDYTQKSKWGGQYAILMDGIEQPNAFSIYDADIVVASTRSIPALRDWKVKTGKGRVAILDGEDGHVLHADPAEAKIYFKREFYPGHSYPKNVKPLQFGAIPESFQNSPKAEGSVFFGAHGTNPFRWKIWEALTALGHPPMMERISKDEYNGKLISSMIGVSVRGGGWDTYRYWETPYFGVATLSDRLEIEIPNNFVEWEEAVFFDDIEDFKNKLRHMLARPEQTAAIACAGRKACLERHMSINRAKAVLDVVY